MIYVKKFLRSRFVEDVREISICVLVCNGTVFGILYVGGLLIDLLKLL